MDSFDGNYFKYVGPQFHPQEREEVRGSDAREDGERRMSDKKDRKLLRKIRKSWRNPKSDRKRRRAEEALESLLEEYETEFRRYFSACLRDLDEVEHGLSRLLEETWFSANRYRGEGTVKAWIFGIARHIVREVRRGRPDAPVDLDDDPRLPPSPSGEECHPLRCDLRRAFMSLPLKYREVIYFYRYEGYTSKETAEILVLTPNQVRSLDYQARKFLRRKLK